MSHETVRATDHETDHGTNHGTDHGTDHGEERQRLKVDDAVSHILEECRMVLPGIQALFGFQLIAVFNAGFREKLTSSEQQLHLAALVLVGVAIAMVMAPAAYHRQVEPKEVSMTLLRTASWLLTLGMVPLMIALTLELYLIARIILGSPLAAGGIAAAMFVVFCGFWFIFPRIRRVQLKGRK